MEQSNKFKISLNKEINNFLNKIINNQAIINLKNTIDISKQNIKKKSNNFFFEKKVQQYNFQFYKKSRFEMKNEFINNFLIKRINNIKVDNSNKREYQMGKRRNNIRDNTIIIRNYIIIKVIKAILINIIFYQIKSKISDLFYFQNFASITLKIKGIGESKFLGDSNDGFNGPSEIKINNNIQNFRASSFNFTQENNYVQLIWNYSIIFCDHMFRQCSNITEIDLSEFDSSKVESMKGMFEGCSSLTSLNLSKLNTSNVENMYYMFRNCSSLTSIDLSNLDTSKVRDMGDLFNNCFSLTSLDLSYFDTSSVEFMDYMFSGCSNLTSLNLSNFDTSYVFYMNNMFYGCINLEYINLNILNELENYENMFVNVPDNLTLCINGEENIVKKIFLQIKNKSCIIIDCSDDLNLSKQKKIIYNNNDCIVNYNYSSSQQTNSSRKLNDICQNELSRYNELCSKCTNKYYPIENDPSNRGIYINCYKDLEGYYLDNDSYKIQCYNTCKTCNIFGNYIDHNCTECNNMYTIKFEHNNNYLNCYYNCSHEKDECYQNLTEIIETEFTEYYNTSKLDNGQDDFIKTEKMEITFTTLQNQKNIINTNITAIDIGECEAFLRNNSNLTNNETLYIKKIYIIQEEKKKNSLHFDVYYKSSEAKLIKLNLAIYTNCKITIYNPINKNLDIDKLNISSGYYHDICYTTTSEVGTDLTLKERQDIYFKEYIKVCPENCEFSGYSQTDAAICSCDFKETSTSSIVDIDLKEFNKKKLFKNFKDIKNSLNLNILICHEKLFTENGIRNNIGAYIISTIILYHIISNIALFISKSKLKFDLNISHQSLKTNSSKDKSKNIFLKKEENIAKIKYNKKITTSNTKLKKENKVSKKPIKSNKLIKKNNFKKNFKKLNDDEINELPYNLALLYDQRTMFDYFASLLKTKHNLLCIFSSNDCDSRLIKIDLFFIGFAIDYAINALFYDDDTMHKIHEREGEYDIESQLPIIIYSFLITIIFNLPINYLALSNEEIINLKQNITNNNKMKKEKCLKRKLAIKLSFFIIINLLLLTFIWYYISMFCVIYRNTQMHLFKDSISCFGISLFFPCGFYLIPGFLRIPSLSNKKNNRKCLYEFSKVIQLFCEYI